MFWAISEQVNLPATSQPILVICYAGNTDLFRMHEKSEKLPGFVNTLLQLSGKSLMSVARSNAPFTGSLLPKALQDLLWARNTFATPDPFPLPRAARLQSMKSEPTRVAEELDWNLAHGRPPLRR